MTAVIRACERLNLGDLIDLMQARNDKEQCVRFDFGHVSPVGIDSFRGCYEDLAIGFEEEPKKYPSVAAFLKLLRDTVGKTFTGYKGGDYKMMGSSRVWVANYSNTSNTTIVGIRDCDYMTVLHTGWEE